MNVTLDKAATKQIDNYTSQQVSNKTIMHGEMHQQVKLKVQWIAVNLSMMINKISILDLSKYQGIDKNRIKRMLFDRPTLLKHTDAFVNAAKEKHVNEVYLISHALLETGSVKVNLRMV